MLEPNATAAQLKLFLLRKSPAALLKVADAFDKKQASNILSNSAMPIENLPVTPSLLPCSMSIGVEQNATVFRLN